jgi:hypothetical protein
MRIQGGADLQTGVHAGRRKMAFQLDYLSLLQWPAMLVTVAAAWFVASQVKQRREIGFWLFLLSNVLWIVWGVHDKAYAVVVLQFALASLNIRGARKNVPESG